MNEDDFSRLPPAAQAYIRELESRNRQLGERIAQLEEQFRLAQSKRFAPSSERLRDRVFDEAEQIAATEAHDEDVADNPFTLPDTGLPDAPEPVRRSPGRKPLPAHLPRQRIEYDLPDEQKICPCCAHELHRMGEEISEQLHIEAKASVLQHVRFRYACRHCERRRRRGTEPVLAVERPVFIRRRDCVSIECVAYLARNIDAIRQSEPFRKLGEKRVAGRAQVNLGQIDEVSVRHEHHINLLPSANENIFSRVIIDSSGHFLERLHCSHGARSACART